MVYDREAAEPIQHWVAPTGADGELLLDPLVKSYQVNLFEKLLVTLGRLASW